MKKTLALVLALVMVFALCACGQKAAAPAAEAAAPAAAEAAAPAAAEAAKPVVAATFYKYDDVYLSSVRAAMEKYAAEAGFDFTCYDGQGDMGKQLDQLDTIIAKGVDCIFVNMTDQSSAPTVIEKVKDAGIPLVFFNREPTDITVLESYKPCLFVGTQAEDAGVMQGDMLYDLWTANPALDRNGDGKVQYVVFKGEADNVEAIARTKYCVDEAVAKGLELEALAETQVCDWGAEKAKNAMDAILATKADQIEVVFCNNDDMATGVVSALQDVGMNTGKAEDTTIVVIGVDATDAGKSAVQSGFMAGTVLQDADGMAKAVVDVAKNFLNGKDALDGLQYKLDGTGVAIRIPYAPWYAQ